MGVGVNTYGMYTDIDFSVPFVRGKGRVRFVRATGRAYTPDATASAMEQIRMAYAKAANGIKAPKGVAVCVNIYTRRPMPKSRPKRVEWEHDIFKPNIDNICKLVLDALNGVAWYDDTQVISIDAFKCDRERDSEERTDISIQIQDWVPDGEF